MRLPRELFYTLPSSEETYSENPSGKLDVERLIEGRPDCFEQTEGRDLLIPKTIVLNNLYPDAINDPARKKFLDFLVKQGFEIFYESWGSFKKYKSEDIYFSKQDQLLSIDDAQGYYAEQLHRPSEQIYVMDYERLFKFTYPHEPIPPLDLGILYKSYLLDTLSDPAIKESFIKYLKSAKFEICSSFLSPKFLSIISELIDKISPKEISWDFNSCTINFLSNTLEKHDRITNQLLCLYLKKLKTIEFSFSCMADITPYSSSSFKLENLSDMELLESADLAINYPYCPQNEILLHRNLQSLKLSFNRNYLQGRVNQSLKIPDGSLLKELSIRNVSDEPLDFSLNYSQCLNLRILKIKKIRSFQLISVNDLPQLEELDIDNIQSIQFSGNTPFNAVRKLSIQAPIQASEFEWFPNLKQINFSDNYNRRNKNIDWPIVPLTQLEILIIGNGFNNAFPPQHIVPSLKKIESRTKSIIHIEQIQSYTQLEELLIMYGKIDKSFNSFFASLNNIKELKLFDCSFGVEDTLGLRPIASLERFNINGISPFPPEDFWLLFSHENYPNLKQISIVLSFGQKISYFQKLLENLSSFPLDTKIAFNLTDMEIDDELMSLVDQFNQDRVGYSQIFFQKKPVGLTSSKPAGEPADPYLEKLAQQNREFAYIRQQEEFARLFQETTQELVCDLPKESSGPVSLNTRIIFYGQGCETTPNRYRLQAFNQLKYNIENPHPVTLIQTQADISHEREIEINPQEPNLFSTIETGQYWGKLDFILNAEQWIPLPSLTPRDEITKLKCFNDKGQPFLDFDICYSKNDQFYYVKLQSGQRPQKLNFEWVIQTRNLDIVMPRELEDLEDLAEIYRRISSDGQKGLTTYPETLDSYVEAIKEQQVGACRHRAIAFFHEVQKKGYMAQIITNDCHAYVEVKLNEQWYTFDLGGVVANLEYYKPYTPTEAASPQSMPQRLSEEASVREVTTVALEEKPPRSPYLSIEYPAPETYSKYFQILTPRLNSDFRTFIEHLLQPTLDTKTILLNFSEPHIHDIALKIYQQAFHTGKRVFYAIHREDLSSRAFKEFLQLGPEPPPVLIIDYNHFSINDILRFSHSLYDIQETAGGVQLPENLKIIGLIDKNSPNAYQGADFTSRFKLHLDLPEKDLPKFTDWSYPKTAIEEPIKNVINLYASSTWKTRLLQHPSIREGEIIEELGLLDLARLSYPIQLISEGENINPEIPTLLKDQTNTYRFYYKGNEISLDETQQSNLRDLNLKDNVFLDFQEAFPITKILQHRIPVSIEIHNPPATPQFEKFIAENKILRPHEIIHILSSDVIDFRMYDRLISHDKTTLPQELKILNPSRFNTFFQIYELVDGKINIIPGILSSARGQTLDILLTRTLSPIQWQEFFDACQYYQIQVRIYYPQEISLVLDTPISEWVEPVSIPPEPQLLLSEYPDYLIKKNLVENQIVIDVSEMKIYELFERISLDPDNPPLGFKKTEGCIPQALANSNIHKIILTGHFSEELQDEFLSYWQSLSEEQKQKIQIITNSPIAGMNAMPQANEKDAIRAHLNTLYSPELVERVMQEHPDSSYYQWLSYLKYPDKDPFLSLRQIEMPLISEGPPVDFLRRRQEMISQVLTESPFVYIAGLTGVGKSQFVISESGYQVINENIEAWAKNPPPDDGSPIILFLDEANLKPTDWSLFRGLFEDPPSIVVRGVLYQLTPQHKVIFAGNPSSYSHDRSIAKLFKEHAEIVVFDPIPVEALLDPSLDSLVSHKLKLCYQFFMHLSKTKVLITPRQIKLMTRLIQNRMGDDELEGKCNFYIQQVMRNSVPTEHLESFSKLFPLTVLAPQELIMNSKDLIVTASRAPQLFYLQTILQLREKNISDAANRVILEGPPGEGKTEFLLQTLIAHGFTQKQPDSRETEPYNNKIFYRLHVSMPPKKVREILIRAFDEGAIVICDEINALNAYEELLNSILDGKHPETREPPITPGFRLIGTQNPMILGGRGLDSPALASRSIVIEFPSYTLQEIEEIAIQKGLNPIRAKNLAVAYIQAKTRAITEKRKSQPCFRDFIKALEAEIRAQKETDEYINGIKIELTEVFSVLNPEWMTFYENYLLEESIEMNKSLIEHATKIRGFIQDALTHQLAPQVIKKILTNEKSFEKVLRIWDFMKKLDPQVGTLSHENQVLLYQWLESLLNQSKKDVPEQLFIEFYINHHPRIPYATFDTYLCSANTKGLKTQQALQFLKEKGKIPTDEEIIDKVLVLASEKFNIALENTQQKEMLAQFLKELKDNYKGVPSNFYDYLVGHQQEFNNIYKLFTSEQFSQLHQALEKGSENVSRWVWANYQIKKQQLQDTKESIRSFVENGKFHAAYQELCKYIVIAQSFRWQEKSTRSYTSFFQELSHEQKSSLPLLPESQKKFTPPSK